MSEGRCLRIPSATLFQADTEGGERKPVSSYSYKEGESFADARLKLETQFEFDFHFIDVNLATRMQEKWEKHNLIEDCGAKIIIIPKIGQEPPTQPLQNVHRPAQQVVGSSNASNGLSVTESVHQDSTPLTEEPEVDLSADSTGLLQEGELQVTLESQLMSSDLKRVWISSVDRLKTHMVAIKCADQKWTVKVWDKDNIPWGHIQCCECEKRVEAVGKDLLMSKTSINNAFTNFKNLHLKLLKHAARVAMNRGETVGLEEIARRARSNTLSNRAILEQHLKIVAQVNTTFAVGREVFTVEGDVKKELVELNRFKLWCNFCLHHLTLIPKQ